MLDGNHGFDNCLYLLMMKHLGFFGKIFVFLLCGEKQRFLNFSVWAETLEYSELVWEPQSFLIVPVLPGAEWQLGETREKTAGKYLTSASDVEKEDGENESMNHSGQKEPSRSPTRWCNCGITQLTLTLAVPEGLCPFPWGWHFVFWCGEVLESGTWTVLKKKKKIRKIPLLT